MKKRIKNISLYMVVIIGFFIICPNKVFAEDIDFDFNAYTCQDLEGATTNTAKRTAATNCITKYLKGQLSSIPDGSDLSPGASIMVTVDFVNNNPDKLGSIFNLHASYDNTNITAFAASSALYKTSQYYLKSTNPVFDEFYEFWGETIQASDEDGRISTKLESTATVADDVAPFFTEEGTLLYLFFTVKEDATPGANIDIGLIESGPRKSIISTFDSTEVTHSQTPISLRVAGDSLNTDNSLKSISVVGNNSLNYESQLNFTAGDSRRNFDLIVPNNVSSIDLSLATNYANAQLIGVQSSPQIGSASNTYNLAVGNNLIEFYVQAEDQNVSIEHYSINIKRLSNDTSLKSLSVKDGNSREVGSLSGNTYTGSVPYATGSVTISAETNHANATITKGIGSLALPNYVYDSTSGLNTETIHVKAENCKDEYNTIAGNSCSEKDYTINITRETPSRVNTLKSLKVDGTSVTDFSPTTYIYTYGTTGGTGTIPFGVPANKDSVNIAAELSDSLGKINSGTGICTLNVGENVCTIDVQAEDPATPHQTYSINIYKLSNDAKLQSLVITPYEGTTANTSLGNLSPAFSEGFDSSTGEYTYSYEPVVTKIAISTSVNDIVDGISKAYISLSDISSGTPGTLLASGTNGTLSYGNITPSITKIQIVVTAEDGTVSYIPINLTRTKSSDNTLKSLKVSNSGIYYTLNPTFTGSNRTYSVKVPPQITSLDVDAVANSGYAKSVEVTGNTGFDFGGANAIKIKVTAENNSSAEYTINVTREKYTESNLTGLSAKVDSEEKITSFAADKYEYNINVPYDVTSINLSATTNPEYLITVTGEGSKDLNTGLNTFTIHTQSQEKGATGTTKDYIVNVTRAKNTDPSIDNISVNTSTGVISGSCNNETHICTLDSDVPNDFTVANSSNVNVGFANPPRETDSKRATATVTRTEIKTTDNVGNTIINEVPISVQPEDTETSPTNYILKIVRTKSSVNILNTFYITPQPSGVEKNCALDSTTECTINVPVDTTSFTVRGSLKDLKSKVTFATNDGSQSGTTYTMTSDQSEIVIIATVTPEIGSPTKTYTITVNRDKSSDNLLEYIMTDASGTMGLIKTPFDKETPSYTITVPGTTTNLNLKAKTNDDKSTITVSGATDTNSAKNILELNKTLDYGTSINTANSSNTITITVKAENGTNRIYTINIIRQHNIDGTLSDLQIDNTTLEDFGSTQYTYNLEQVPYSKTSLDISAVTNDPLAKVTQLTVNGINETITASNSIATSVNLKTGTNQIKITVKSHDENATNTKIYTINVERAYNTDRTITSINVKWNSVNHSVTCNSSKECTIDGDLEVPYNFTNANDTNILFTFKNPALNETERASAVVTATDLLTTDSEFNQIVNEVPFTIYSEADRINDTSGDNYILKIKRTRNNENNLNQVNVYTNGATTNPKTCNFTTTTCNLDVPTNTTSIKVEGILVDTIKSRVTFSKGSGENIVIGPTFDFPLLTDGSPNNTITIDATVLAEDGSTKSYSIIITREKSADNYLKSLVVNGYSITPSFSSPVTNYSLSLPDEVDNVDISAEANDTRATVNATDLVDTTSNIYELAVNKDLVTGLNTVTITVTAENNTERIYTLNITRRKAINPNLSNLVLEVPNGSILNLHEESDFDTEDAEGNYTYTFASNVTYQTTYLDISAITEDSRAKIVSIDGKSIDANSVSNNRVDLVTTDNQIEIVTAAHDESVIKTYKINVYREESTDTTITNLVFKNGTENIQAIWNDERNLYEVKVPNTITEANDSNVIVSTKDGITSYDDKQATASVTTTALKTTDDDYNQVENIVLIRVTSEEGTYKDYQLAVTRTRSSNKVLSSVEILEGTDLTGSVCRIVSNACTGTIKVGTTSFTLKETLPDAKARITYSSGTQTGPTFQFPLTDSEGNANSNMVVTATVLAEDGTTEIYTITINRALSSDNKISELVVTDIDGAAYVLNPEFDYINNPTNQVFNLTVADEITNLNIYAKAHDERTILSFTDTSLTDTNSSISIVETNKTLVHDVNNQIIISSTAQNGDAINYTINVTRLRGTNTKLNSLVYNHVELSNPVSVSGLGATTFTYDIGTVAYTTTNIDLSAVMEDQRGIIDNIKVNGKMITLNNSTSEEITTYNATAVLKTGANAIVITTKAHDTTKSKTYTLTAYRTLNDNKDISKIEINTSDGVKEATCSNDTDEYGRTICYASGTTNPVIVPHNSATLDSSNIVVTVPAGQLSSDAKASVSITSTNLITTDDDLNQVTNSVPIRVTAEDTTTKDYVIYVKRTLNDINTMTRFDVYVGLDNTAVDESTIYNYCLFENGLKTCTITVPQNTTSFKVDSTLTDSIKSRVSYRIDSTIGDTFPMGITDEESTKTLTATVTAENGTTNVYTILIERKASNNSFLSSLKTNAKQSPPTNLVSVPDFNQTVTEYTVEVEGDQDTLLVEAIAFDTKSSVTIDGETYNPEDITNKIKYTKTLNEPGNDTTIKVVVTPEDLSEPRIYTITVKRQSNTEPYLSMIYINGRSINDYMTGTTFDGRNQDEYILNELPYSTYNVAITADNVDATYGKVKVNGIDEGTGVSVDLQTKYYGHSYPVDSEDEYVNVITVTGIAHDTSVTKNYTIKVKRTPNDDTTIKKVEMKYDGVLHEAICDLINYRCSITVPYTVNVADSNNVIVTPNDGNLATDAKATITMNPTNLSTISSTNHTFTVTSEDGLRTKNYTLTITREKSDNPVIKSILVYDVYGNNVIGSFNPSFDPAKPDEQQVYTVTVPDGTEAFKVYAVPDEEHAIITGASTSLSDTRGNNTLIDSFKTVTVTSRSEDNSATKTYTLNIVRTANADLRLGSISIVDQSGNEYNPDIIPDITNGIPDDTTEFNVTVPSSVTELNFDITPNNRLASISYGTGSGIANPISANNNQATYDVISNNSYRMEVIVTSEAGVPKPYYINVNVEPNGDNTLSSLTYKYSTEIPTELISDTTKRIFDLGTVPNSTSSITISATAKETTSIVGGQVGTFSLTTADSGNTFTITVQAESGDIENYQIKVKREKSNVATLDSLNINGISFKETFKSNVFTYTAEVQETRDLISASEVNYIKTDSNSTVTITDLSLPTSGDYVYKVLVTAENGIDKNEYIINLTKLKSTNDYLKNVILSTGTITPTFDKNNQLYTITVPQTARTIDIEGIKEVDSATVSGNGTYDIVEGKEISISVQAEVGSATKLPRVYKFVIVIAKSNVATLDDLSVTGHTFSDFSDGLFHKTSSKTTYTVKENLDRTVTKLQVNAIPTNTDANIYYYKDSRSLDKLVCSGKNLNSCTMDVIQSTGKGYIFVYVVAADGTTTKEYTIEYNKVKSDNNYLSNITTSEGTLSPIFSSGVNSYTINLPSEIDELDLEFTAADTYSSIKYLEGNTEQLTSLTVPVRNILEGESKTITVEVTAEDEGTPRQYVVVINRAIHLGSGDTSIDSITVVGDGVNYPVHPNVQNDITLYDIGTIPFSLEKLNVTVVAHDGKSTVTYAGPGESYNNTGIVNVPKENGQKAINIQVRAENGTIKDYAITYNKQADNNNYLSNLTISGYTLNHSFDKNLGVYELTTHLTKDEDSLIINATKESEYSIVTINGEQYVSGTNKTIQNLNYGLNTIKILVTSESGNVRTYIITVVRDSDQEIITSRSYGHIIEDGYIKSVADQQTVLDLKNQLDNDNIKLQIWTSDNTTQLSDSDRVGTGMIVKLIVNGVMTDSKIVIIKGDITGDGIINMMDAGRIANHFLDRVYIMGDPYIRAADIDNNSTINMIDAGRIANHFLDRVYISFK